MTNKKTERDEYTRRGLVPINDVPDLLRATPALVQHVMAHLDIHPVAFLLPSRLDTEDYRLARLVRAGVARDDVERLRTFIQRKAS